MGWVAFSIVLVGFTYLALRFPEFRRVLRWIAIGAVLLVLGFFVILFFIDLKEARRREAARSMIKPEQVELVAPVMTISFGSGMITGRVKNGSPYPLKSFQFAVQVTECPTTGECQVIGEDRDVSVFLDVPSLQVREFSGYAALSGTPIPASFNWTYEIREVEADIDD